TRGLRPGPGKLAARHADRTRSRLTGSLGMQPGYDLRIRSMMKALAETVIPAIESTKRAAVEQAHIVLGSLELLREQIDYAHWFEVSDARDMARLIRALIREADLPSAGEAEATAADALLEAARHDVPLSRLREANRRLRGAIRGLIEDAFAALDAGVGRRVQALVLEHGKVQIGRERAFVAAAGFDVFPDDLQSIDQAFPSRPLVS